MTDVHASFSVGPSPLTRPMLEGEVKPKGLDLDIREFKSMDDNSRRMLDLEFDIAEMSIATYSKAREQNIPLIALPLFTSGRRFMHTSIHLSTRSGIKDLSELRGRTVGASQYWMSSSIWQRQVLHQVYGLAPEDVAWTTVNKERMAELRIPAGVKHHLESEGRSVRDLAAAGEIDAAMAVSGPKPEGQPDPLVPAFPDREAAQREYYQRTGIFPIVHITVLKRELADREPTIIDSLFAAYLAAKKLAESRLGSESGGSGHGDDNPDATVRALGGDPWAYGIAANRKPLEAFVATAYDQGLVARQFSVDDLFARDLPA